MNYAEIELAKELAKYSGLVVGGNGKGGSGVCIRLDDESIAILTAKHVVIECLRNTGRIAIAAFGSQFLEPKIIRMDSSAQGDAAYLVFQEIPDGLKAIPFDEWTKNRTDIAVGQRVYVCGFPGALKAIEGRMVGARFAWVGDKILSIRGDRVVSGINETIEGIPSTFHGISGGGLFSDDGRFIGIVVEENRHVSRTHGEIYSIIPSEFAELYTPFSMPSDSPTGGFFGEDRSVSLALQKPDGSGVQAIVGVSAQCYWSRTNPNHKHGRIGRLVVLEFIIPGIDTHYPINIESMFTWVGDTEEDRLRAIHEEFRYLLMRIGWLVRDDGPDGITIQVNPMT